MAVEGIKSGAVCSFTDPKERSNNYLKKKQAAQIEQPCPYASSITSLNPASTDMKTEGIQAVNSRPVKRGVFDSIKDWVSDTVENIKDWVSDKADWIKDKWNSFLEFVGIRSPTTTSSRDPSKRAKIMDRHSRLDLEEDFKYLDIATMDPLRVMLAILVKQGELREEQALLIQQKVLLAQEDLKDLHDERMKLNAELALVSERSGVIEKANVVLTVGQVIAGILATAAVVAGAATIATGGAAAPFLVVTGALNGVVHGGKAFTTWYKGTTDEKLNKLQAEMLTKTSKRDEYQFQLKVDVKDMKRILWSLSGHAETGSSILSAQYGK